MGTPSATSRLHISRTSILSRGIAPFSGNRLQVLTLNPSTMQAQSFLGQANSIAKVKVRSPEDCVRDRFSILSY